MEAISIVSEDYPHVQILTSNWWDVLSDDVISKLFDTVPFKGWALEHAALTETSLIMYLAPEMVYAEHMLYNEEMTPVPYQKYPIVPGMVPSSGVLASVEGATADKGKLIVDFAVEKFAQIIQSEFK
ncbi:MAG: hypothetical protein ATN33_06485 [Epulopiscium sp. Nele67-Bin001]|nr:MAG: hypothetical protein ATN33_06485 [Epulopiscium sp. Nele67-Bin001]